MSNGNGNTAARDFWGRMLEKFGLPTLILVMLGVWFNWSLWPAIHDWGTTLVNSHAEVIATIKEDMEFRNDVSSQYMSEWGASREQLNRIEDDVEATRHLLEGGSRPAGTGD